MSSKPSNLKHWDSWARTYGTELRATTKCLTIKRLETEAFAIWIDRLSTSPKPVVLEIGCGNGINEFALAARQRTTRYLALDFSTEMIENAVAVARQGEGSPSRSSARIAFGVADARSIRAPLDGDIFDRYWLGAEVSEMLPASTVDFVITDRMLINLDSPDEQLAVMRRISSLLSTKGVFLMLENSIQTHRALNQVRARLGLPWREPAPFNVFVDEPAVIEPFREQMTLLAVDDFAAIHDLMLYAVQPALEGGEIDYDTPLMRTVTEALITAGPAGREQELGFGQNRLWVWQKS